VRALTDLTRTSGTLAEERAGLDTLYGTATATSQDLTTYLRQNSPNLIRLAAGSRGTLGLLAEYAPSFPCTLRTLADFVPVMDRALGKGTHEPGLHVDVTTVASRGRYLPGRDTPVYDASGGPRCYPVPYTGQGTPALANSPQENELINELLAPGAGTPSTALPDWGSLLTGPVFRGAEVTVR
jgi:phospholipid/cholesterol/gamma-HCH transport system substrate-binding protein